MIIALYNPDTVYEDKFRCIDTATGVIDDSYSLREIAQVQMSTIENIEYKGGQAGRVLPKSMDIELPTFDCKLEDKGSCYSISRGKQIEEVEKTEVGHFVGFDVDNTVLFFYFYNTETKQGFCVKSTES